MRLATSERWRDKSSGEQRERTEWHRIVIFSEGLARIAEQYLRKGSKVYIEGQLQTRKWQDQATQQDRYTTEVVLQGFGGSLIMLDNRGGGGGSTGGSGDNFASHSNDSSPSPTGNDFDDDIPF